MILLDFPAAIPVDDCAPDLVIAIEIVIVRKGFKQYKFHFGVLPGSLGGVLQNDKPGCGDRFRSPRRNGKHDVVDLAGGSAAGGSVRHFHLECVALARVGDLEIAVVLVAAAPAVAALVGETVASASARGLGDAELSGAYCDIHGSLEPF